MNNILVVDDDQTTREYYERLLITEGGAIVLHASNSAEAQQILNSRQHEIWGIITDINRPGGDGIEFSEWAHHKYPQLPIFIISGNLFDGRRERASALLGAGVIKGLLQKPFTPPDLINMIDRYKNSVGYEIDFLPVGDGKKSGDAIAIRFGNLLASPPQQKVIVIDGGFKDSGIALVNHIRQYYRTDHIDAVILTHPDNDHASGLEVVLNEMSVGCLVMHLPWEHTEDTEHLFEDDRVTDESVKRKIKASLDVVRSLEIIAKKKEVSIIEPFYGVTGFHGTLRVLGPTAEFYKSLLPGYRCTPEEKAGIGCALAHIFVEAKKTIKKVLETWGIETLNNSGESNAENNSSAIVLLTIGRESMLFTGDAGIPALTEAVVRLQGEGFDFKTLGFIQVPHHGSKRNIDPSLLNILVGPKLQNPANVKMAFASASVGGAPKHPAQKVLNAFLRRGAPVHVTAGNTKSHHKNAPAREGWVASVAEQFHSEVDE